MSDPLLGPLADNGGLTLTRALLPGSLAIDAGHPLAVAGMDGVPEFDQRGAGFDRTVGIAIDIGAFEVQAAPPPVVGDYNGDGSVNAADYTVWRDTLGSTTDLRANGDESNSVIDAADYGAWTANFGETLGAGASQPPALPADRGASLMDAAFARATDTSVRPSVYRSTQGGQESPSYEQSRILALLDLLDSLPEREMDEEIDAWSAKSESNEEAEREEAFAGLELGQLQGLSRRL